MIKFLIIVSFGEWSVSTYAAWACNWEDRMLIFMGLYFS